MVNTFNLEVLYKSIELILLFWLLGLLFKWVLTFIFGEKGARVIGFLGYTVNFYLKKFVLTKIFKIEIHECDPFKLKFIHEETDRWDILFSSLVLVPMGIGLLLGSLIGSVGLLLESNLVLLSSFLYIFGFLIAVNSVPSYQDIKELSKASLEVLTSEDIAKYDAAFVGIVSATYSSIFRRPSPSQSSIAQRSGSAPANLTVGGSTVAASKLAVV